MANVQRNFVLGRMNKSLDERLVPNGEYVDALNVRLGSTESSEVGSVETTKGNTQLTTIQYNGEKLSDKAKCIGAYEDGANETLYWFVHDPEFSGSSGTTNKLDLIISFNTLLNILTYHVISIDDGGGVNSVLNFNELYLITGVNLIEDLLFFTDDFNPPRFININRNYPNPIGNIDQIIDEDLLVIKKPPITSLDINPIATSSQETFLEDRFVCFAYRYRYKDGEYSATSQFSNPSFIPGAFRYDFSTGLNQGMLNVTNQSTLTYNSGGPLVVGVDLLWKDMQTGSIRVIEKLDKQELGLVDNTNFNYTFNNSKIFTVLVDSEILRLYDNVPRLAKAQTLMGNRLIYGNYLEQYDTTTLSGFLTKLEYTTELVSEEVGLSEVEDSTEDGNYSIDGANTVTNAIVTFDLDGLDLVAGGVLELQIKFEHFGFTGPNPPTPNVTTETEVNFTYILPQNFASAYDLGISVDFLDKIGTISNIQTVADSCLGSTLTDFFNCSIPNSLGSLNKFESGINGPNEPIAVIVTPASTQIKLQLPAMRFVDDPLAITQWAYEYYSVSFGSATFQLIGDPKSLHSNRSYEVGIIYMDDYNRATTALVSQNNTVNVPCSLSEFANSIRVNIPTTQIAPSWATRYKFCIKADKDTYFNIYSNFFFRDPTTSADFFLLEGQNSQKVEEGDLLTVKRDTNGPVNRCAFATVLDKKAQEREFLDPAPLDVTGVEIPVPQGVYMKMRATDFATTVGELPVVAYGEFSSSGSGCRTVQYPVDREDPATPGTYIDYTIPAGSRITIVIDNHRRGNTSSFLGGVPQKTWRVDTTFTASQEYSNFKDWFDGDNIAVALEAQAQDEGTGVSGPGYNNVLNGSFGPCGASNTSSVFQTGVGPDGRTTFSFKSSKGYGGKKKRTTLKVKIEVIRSNSLLVFETQPQDASPDVWYESSESFSIDPATGFHNGNVQPQTATDPAIIDTAFFNCYAFGNGVESFQIRDAIEGKTLVLGNRVTTTSAQDYQEIRRFADLTYSGVYNDESNVNKLNEFNLGLLNFKPLEESYGPVYVIDGRETDVLTLQEDKISYVLAGKNLLSDSAGGGSIASVPEVLGTQIARIEEYGVSMNPESYTKWGMDKYFTDAKRGAVIQLKGSSGQNERLTVISESGMRSWFRDLFLESFNTQKLGAFDPYMNEYVLNSNNTLIPSPQDCIECGVTRILQIDDVEKTTFCVDVGSLVGDVNIDYNIISVSSNVKITANYGLTSVTTGFVNNNTGSPLVVDKNDVAEDIVEIEVGVDVGTANIEITVNCPDAQEITIIQVCYSIDNDAGLFIHNEYRWVDGTFVSPLHSEQVELVSGNTNPLISQYNPIVGPQGAGFIPADSAEVSIITNKIIPVDDYVFDTSVDELRYLRSNTLYNNTPAEMASLMAASSIATPITGGPNTYEASFIMPNTDEQYLYLIYDYRRPTLIELCYDASTAFAACCECTAEVFELQKCGDTSPAGTQIANNSLGVSIGDFVELASDPNCVFEVIADSTDPVTTTMTLARPDITNCNQVCNEYKAENLSVDTIQVVNYTDCFGASNSFNLGIGASQNFCALEIGVVAAEVIVNLISCACTPPPP